MSTLYLTHQYSSVQLMDEILIVKIPANKAEGTEASKRRIPLNKVTQAVVFGSITLSTQAIVALLARKAEICYLTRYGKFVARICGDDHKHGYLRLQQRRAHDDPTATLHVAKVCVKAKLHNQRTLLLRSNRERGNPHIAQAAEAVDAMLTALDALPDTDIAPPDPTRPQDGTVLGQLMGIEGRAAASYFGVFGDLFLDKFGSRFLGRRKRPPTDPINALLSFGYTLLTNQAVGAAHIVGLDPYVGFLHSTQYGRPAVALDVIEMFRAPIVDSVVLTLLNNRMLDYTDFEESVGAWRLTERGRKIFLEKFEERMTSEITHPLFKTKVTYRRCIELQMRLLARWLIGELGRFRGFHTR